MAENVVKDQERGPEWGDSVQMENERVQIDTAAPFESVKEAVTRFGQLGYWKKPSLLKQPHEQEENQEAIDIAKLGDEVMALEKEVNLREREALQVLKEFGAARKTVEELKFRIQKEAYFFPQKIPDHGLELLKENEILDRGSILAELDQAKLNLSKVTNGLDEIQAYIETLGDKLEGERKSLEKKTWEKTLAGEGGNKVEEAAEISEKAEEEARGCENRPDKIVVGQVGHEAEKLAEAEIHLEEPKTSTSRIKDQAEEIDGEGENRLEEVAGEGKDTCETRIIQLDRVDYGRNPTLTIGQILSRKLYVPELSEIELLARQGIIRQNVSLGQMLSKPITVKSSYRKRKSSGLGRFSVLKCKQNKRKKTMPTLDLR